jgi:mannose-1-phosphate guanylyltransferase
MRAMVLAAGRGTRLRPLTNDRPKALVTVSGRTLLEITLARLRFFGIRDVIINVHHFADHVVEYLRSHDNFGLRIEISREDILLDTGGGLKKAAQFFLERADHDEPFLLHNVDVISTIDFQKMLHVHTKEQALATLATQHRTTSRYLLFDETHNLCGRRKGNNPTDIVRETFATDAVGFCGIHILSPRLLSDMTEPGSFSIIDTYLRLSAKGERIVSFSADEYYWRDLGKPESIKSAEVDYAGKLFF